MLDRIADRGAPVSADRTLSWFRVMCNWAIGRGLIETSPCSGITAPEPETPRERFLADDELVAVWDAADALTRPFDAFVKMLVLTGQRASEVGNLEWSEVDLEAKLWTLPAGRAKNGREHTIPLSGLACAILRSLPRHYQSPFVFTLRGSNPIRAHYLVKRRLDELLPSKMEAWTLHDVRRSVATGMAGLGVNLPTIERLLNHISGSFKGIVSVYQRHDFAREKAAAVELWAQHIDEIIGVEADNVVRIRK